MISSIIWCKYGRINIPWTTKLHDPVGHMKFAVFDKFQPLTREIMSLVINNQHGKSVIESKEEKFSRFQPVKTRNFFVMCVFNHLKFTRHIITSGYHINLKF